MGPNKLTMKKIIGIIVIFIFAISCNMSETAKMKENLPKARGKRGHILVVIDSTQWKGVVGETIREVFQEIVPGLPRDEPSFNLQQVDPIHFSSILKVQQNIIFVTILNSKLVGDRKLKTFFTGESLKMIREDSSIFRFTKKEDFAKGQEILHLFGKTKTQLVKNLRENAPSLRNFFNEIAKKRTYQALYKAKTEKGINKRIKEKFNCSIKIPYGYEIAMDEDDFIWIRNYNRNIDKNIFISRVPYTSKDQFSLDSLIATRESMARPYILYKPDDGESYMITETKYRDIIRQEINFSDHYAVRLQGLWKLNKYTMGGPFVSYAMVDETSNQLCYIEGFLYSPGVSQREFMRELDVILNTFKPSKKKR